jgi:CheY-like chemotaxis protein
MNKILTKTEHSILLVDDNLMLRELGKDTIESFGYKVTLAESGSEAIALSKKFYFDLIILDIRMPGLDGFETLKKLKTNPNCPKTMALTGLNDEVKIEKFTMAGFKTVLSKPYTIQQCFNSITKALNY